MKEQNSNVENSNPYSKKEQAVVILLDSHEDDVKDLNTEDGLGVLFQKPD